MGEWVDHGKQHAQMIAAQAGYMEAIIAWLSEKMPELCKADERIVECERRLHGEQAALELAAESTPHFAAIAAVTRLHQRHGKRSLTVRQHGPAIRAAVKAADEKSIADYRAIENKRTTEQEVPS